MNQFNVIGRLTHDPELSQTPSNISVTRFSIAVSRSYKNADGGYDADFFNCVAWRSAAEIVCKYFVKGQQIAIVGSIENNNYTDANGVKHKSDVVKVDKVEFCGSKSQQQNRPAEQQQSVNIGDLGEFEEILNDGDIPF